MGSFVFMLFVCQLYLNLELVLSTNYDKLRSVPRKGL